MTIGVDPPGKVLTGPPVSPVPVAPDEQRQHQLGDDEQHAGGVHRLHHLVVDA
jgi:hypothetical protein